MDPNNSLNYSITYQQESIPQIIICGLMSLSLVFDVLCFVTIAKSRQNLIKAEMLILISIQIFTLIYKVISILLSFGILANVFLFGRWTCVCLYPGLFWSSTSFNTVLIYYSLLHFSALRSGKLNQQLFVAVRNIHNFVAFLLLSSLLIFIFMSSYFILLRRDVIRESNRKCHLNILDVKALMVICLSNIPLFPVITIYIVSILRVVLRCRKRRRSNSIVHRGARNERKVLKISLKFISFIFIPILGFAFRLLFPILAHTVLQSCSKTLVQTVHLLIFVTFIIEPVFLIYIHNILYLKFTEMFIKPVIKCFNNFRVIKK